ncbi:TIGR01244 family sulfur transferase [Qipengyuania sp. SS22]|uniref:TIGR01244 family sulfur transferase n=1 Tax=Qipengyuania sp. SS22 TaxID=2979461 RepID=UPI0021E5EAEE|nr:TIGR01244 family sulfur transferase [Qipengyuania sp. SS22]UYH54135.1 TIGR01244 family sulfur transferase [Qipengyuania sp. SS22]
MTINEVTERFAVAPQVQVAEMQSVADAGYGTVICNRPDGEEDGQPTVAEMREAAERAGLAFHHIPVAGGAFPAEAIAAFRQVRQQAEGKVLAYCRTGTRSITLDTLANIEQLSADARIERARQAGYDLSALRPQLGT